MPRIKRRSSFAPLSVSAAIAADKSLLLNTHIAGFAQSIADPKDLASREAISSASSVSTRFQGVIATLKVVVAASMLECPFEIEVDLNGGQELKLRG